MLFASLTFLLGFLPFVISGAFLTRRLFGVRACLGFLVLASLVFYGWHYPPYVLLLVGSVLANFLLALTIHREGRKLTLVIGVTLNLGLLGWFKYAGFFAGMLEAISGTSIGLAAIALPLGISFFTFQQIAYLVDIYQGKARPGHALQYAFFITFFPQLIAGPIVHHSQLIGQLSDKRFAAFRAEDVAAGALLFCIGLAKKVLIADTLAVGADTMFLTDSLGVPLSMAESWLGMLCYTFQIYFDFSGYTDMALGLGLMFGLVLPENFRSPYKSKSIIEFWRRWNMTLSAFLRDYLYFPLGGNRRGPIRRYANLWIVMLLGGLWHGAGMQFVMWGALHGLYLTVNHVWSRHLPGILPRGVGYVLTFLAVVIAWVFFRADGIGQGLSVLGAMFGNHFADALALTIFADAPRLIVMVLFAAVLCFAAPNALQIVSGLREGPRQTVWYGWGGTLAAFALFNIYASGSYAFIYFQF